MARGLPRRVRGDFIKLELWAIGAAQAAQVAEVDLATDLPALQNQIDTVESLGVAALDR